ncbi:ABC transporter permease subunit [Spirochaeta cellobiosiphila]|uniref:ABC transporter permease subunit n=1 Tax=Spirochaeta cellobiosiphila TaxID=504483 RepID=UPI0004299C35|nr:galactoside ABC transporter permease [Spirochaeta cellobiosiphila]
MENYREKIAELKPIKLKELENTSPDTEVKSLEEDELLPLYQQALHDLREEGVNKVRSLSQHIVSVKKNRMLESEAKAKQIELMKEEIKKAKEVAATNKAEEKELAKEAVDYANKVSDLYIKHVTLVEDKKITQAKKEYEVKKKEVKESFAKRIASLNTKSDINIAKYEQKSAMFDIKNEMEARIDDSKAVKKQAYVDHIQTNRSLRNGKAKLSENMALNFKNYVYEFKVSKFFLENGLYLAIGVFFIVCFIVAPLTGNGNLLTLPNIFTLLEQASTRMFYALGVAVLILQAGTDLSVGRMVAVGAITTGLILHPGMNIVTFMGMGPWDFTAIPMMGRLGLALLLSIILCTAFSMLAGFFTAKFKIHPFISTLATQLIIYGLLFFGTSGTPVGSIDGDIKNLIGGRWILGIVNGELVTFPKLIIPAIIAIFVSWFIWNKTTFGKYMYAVGGNPEAASVSGISVFKVTMGVFALAGIYYGAGAFLEAFKANASAGTGQGYELDAIAACVVGGISFFGGIGKVKGAVIGVIIFTGLTYCLTFLGIDTNLQFVFKGFILLAAVTLDSVKYVKKR